MKRTATLFAILLLAIPLASSARAQERPNILLIVADDLGYADIGVRSARPGKAASACPS